MTTFIKVNLLIISIILFEFAWLYAAKANETIDYECPSVAGAALEAGYSLRAFDNDLWELSKNEDSAFYIAENSEVCSYRIFANIISNNDLDLSEFINNWHKEKLIGKIYTDERGFVFENTVLLPQASEELLEINISVFNRSANNLLEGINEHVAEISLTETEDEKDIKGNWFKAYIEACFHAEKECEQFEDMYGPYQTRAECFERAKEMISGVRELLGDGEFGYKCEQSEQSI